MPVCHVVPLTCFLYIGKNFKYLALCSDHDIYSCEREENYARFPFYELREKGKTHLIVYLL